MVMTIILHSLRSTLCRSKNNKTDYFHNYTHRKNISKKIRIKVRPRQSCYVNDEFYQFIFDEIWSYFMISKNESVQSRSNL